MEVRSGAAGGIVAEIGELWLLAAAAGASLRRPREWFRLAMAETRQQIVQSLPLSLLLSVLAGALIAQQTGYQFQGSLPAWVVGSIVAASLVTEMTPLFTGFAMVGIIGTRIAAELSAMQVSEQVDALEVIGRDPVPYLVVPRVVAGFLAGPVLMTFALAASMISGWISALATTRADSADFWFGVHHYMRDFPLFYAIIKAAAFGGSISFVAAHIGLRATGGSEGVGRSTRRAVVAMLAVVILLDTVLVPLLKLAG